MLKYNQKRILLFISFSGWQGGCSELFGGSRRTDKTQPVPPGGGGGIGSGWFCGAGCGGGRPESLRHRCSWQFRPVVSETQGSIRDFLHSFLYRKRENEVKALSVRSLSVKLIASSAASYPFLRKNNVCYAFLVSGPTSPPRWHRVCPSGQAIVCSAAAHRLLTLSPAIWHCLTKDTNIPNWIQPLCELFLPILRKKQHDVEFMPIQTPLGETSLQQF